MTLIEKIHGQWLTEVHLNKLTVVTLFAPLSSCYIYGTFIAEIKSRSVINDTF